jgi:hypothetical protein
MAIHVPLAGMVVAIAVAGRMMDWTTVTVTVEARIAGLEAEVDWEVGVEVDTPVVRLDEELFAVVKLVEEVFDAVVAALMQEQALRIFEDEDLQPELIAEGVEIAIFVAYVLQKEDAWARSEWRALRHLSLLQLADASRTNNETMQKIAVCTGELWVAEEKNMIELWPRKRNGKQRIVGMMRES